MLQAVADCVRCNTRESDLMARFGGDEFVILAGEMDYDAAQRFIYRMQSNLREAMALRNWPVTFSIGAATFIIPPASIDEVIKTADDLMYAVKRTQKNSIKHELVNPHAAESRETPADDTSQVCLAN